MVLCFTKFLLDEKRQLSRIWLAAHWEKKMKKSQIFEVNIERSVQDIMSGELILDLRISGHLLVGIVKIHSRKTKYLLNECSSIFYQVKTFHAGVIDLPESRQAVSTKSITISEYFGDLEKPDDNVIDAILTANQCHIEDITLKETFGNLTLIDEDDMMDFEPAEEDLMMFDHKEMLKMLNDEESITSFSLKPKEPTTTIEQNLDVALLETDKDNLQILNEVESFAPTQFELDEQQMEEIDDMVNNPIETLYPENMVNVIHEKRDEKEIESSSFASVERFPTESVDVIDSSLNANLKSVEELYLEPIKNFTGRSKPYKLSRKRKFVDEIRTLSYDKIEKQIIDTSDIISMLDLAPTSKHLMTLKKTGSAAQLLCLPALKVPNTKLLYLYKRNLKICKNGFNFEEFYEASPEISLNLQKRSKKSYEECYRDEIIAFKDSEIFSSPTHETENYDVSILQNSNFHSDAFDIHEQENLQYNSFEENVAFQFMKTGKDPPSNAKHSDDSSKIQNTQLSKTSEARENMLRGRVCQMLHHLKLLFKESETVGFSSIIEKKKSLVAQQFSCLLVMRKLSIIRLEQSESYGEINISPGNNFISACYKEYSSILYSNFLSMF